MSKPTSPITKPTPLIVPPKPVQTAAVAGPKRPPNA